jgi:hypothetical protein
MRRGVGTVIVALAALSFVQAASAARGMLVGARDDRLKR